jgi:putative ABC transport system permease protein
MIKNHLKVAFRNIIKHKGFSIINIVGLATGIACSIFIFLFVAHELSYDKFHEKAERIYRIAVRASIGDTKIRQTYSSSETFRKLLEDFPEIEAGVKFLGLGRTPVILRERTFYESRFYAVDSTFFDVFTFPLIHGDPETALVQPNSMVISKTTALKYFGSTDVIGKTLRAALTSRLLEYQKMSLPTLISIMTYWRLHPHSHNLSMIPGGRPITSLPMSF